MGDNSPIIEASVQQTGSKHDTKFKPGQSGNPHGRPKESILAKTVLLQASEEIAQEVVKQAKEGNLRACELALSKVVPSVQAVELTDNRDHEEEDMSGYTEDQLQAIKQKQSEIQAIKDNPGKTQA